MSRDNYEIFKRDPPRLTIKPFRIPKFTFSSPRGCVFWLLCVSLLFSFIHKTAALFRLVYFETSGG